jgi:hypothetical protein
MTFNECTRLRISESVHGSGFMKCVSERLGIQIIRSRDAKVQMWHRIYMHVLVVCVKLHISLL